jgi:hypothetical protein
MAAVAIVSGQRAAEAVQPRKRGQEPIKSPAQKAGLFAFPATSDKRLKLVAFFNVYYGKTGLDNQAHTTLPSASGALVCSAISVHRIPPHVRDDRETPL